MYGLAVVGTVAPDAGLDEGRRAPGRRALPDEAARHGAARPRAKAGPDGAAELAEAVELMQTLNAAAADLARAFEPHAVTDVTGFGLLGHATSSRPGAASRIELDAGALPALPGALELAARGRSGRGATRATAPTSAAR